MKQITQKSAPKAKPDETTKIITASLRQACREAVKQAPMHGTHIDYLRQGKLVSKRQ